MVKRSIKIIKRKRKGTSVVVPKIVSPDQREAELTTARIKSVNNWISERRENEGIEKEDSDRTMIAWRKRFAEA